MGRSKRIPRVEYVFFLSAVLALLFVGICSFTRASAQENDNTPHFAGDIENLKPLPPGGPTPHAGGHPDLSGVWYPNSGGTEIQIAYLSASPNVMAAKRQFDPAVTPEDPPVFKPGMAAKYVKKPAPPLEYGTCAQPGTPTTLLQENGLTWPMQIVQAKDLIALLVEYPMDYRVIPTDGRPHQKDPDPTFNGDSVAHWEGDTLVVDTVAIDTRLWNFGAPQWYHSDQEHVIERFSRPSLNYLIHQVTIEDPMVLAKPWNSAPRKWSLSIHKGELLGEFFCTHNEEPGEIQKQTSDDLYRAMEGQRKQMKPLGSRVKCATL